MRHHRASLSHALLSAASLSVLAAHAAAAAESAAPAQVEEVVVTANRGAAEALQKVPMAISAINPTLLDRAGQISLTDLAKVAPSLSITETAPGYQKFDMRGLSTGRYATSDTSDRSLVAVYVDDTPISVQGQTPDLKVFDLERVEVLRGPQGTLFGASSMAGTIRYVTAKPSVSNMFGSVEATGSTTQHGDPSYSLRGMINLPLSETVALRGAVYKSELGGYIDNIGARNKDDANLARTEQGRIALRWTPNDQLTVDLSGTFEHSRAYGLNQGLSGLADYTISTNSPEGTNDRLQLYSLNIAYNLGRADVISTTSYTTRHVGFNSSPEPQIGYFFQDYGSGLPVGPSAYPLFKQPAQYDQAITNSIPPEMFQITNRIHDFMQEVRVVSHDDGPVRWTAGAFYERQSRRLWQDIPVPGFDRLSYENYFYGPFNTPDGRYNSQTVDHAFNPDDIFSGLQNIDEHQFALYADGTWHVTDKLDVTAGVRWFDFHEKYYLFSSGVYGVVDHVPLTLNAKQKADGFNPRFNVSYQINPDVMVYAEAAKGFRYGGANQPVPLGTAGVAGQCTRDLANYGYTSAPLTFGPDHLWNYSIGQKGRFADGRIALDAAVYYIDWQDVQTRLGLNCSYFFTDNKGSITSKGFEVESTVKLTQDFTFRGSLSFNDAKANGDIPTVGAFDGDRTPYFPKWIFTTALFYDRNLGDGMLHLMAAFNYRGKEQTTFSEYATTIVSGVLTPNGPNARYAVIPAAKDLSLSLAYDWDRYEFGLFGTNLTNDVKVTDVSRATYYKIYQAGDRVTLARPRTIGARIKARF
ncbi:TonB-dependent receptor [Phenylobacterium sp.]|uniref:TonB-dependent receptor n=1 Tax=Phenylobacterium sp. TaxID=1871053 RepID=UPI0025E1E834|nr:TonB-dependent receptor [Phenylobacterium sp.]